MIKPYIKAVHHMFMPGETVTATIKKYNLYQVTREEMPGLLEMFKEVNTAENPKPGMNVLIPILERLQPEVFKSV
jgi:hypothetical protein